MPYFVYILECSDTTYYTGITNDLKKRIAAHNSGEGAKYTRGRHPVELVYFEECVSKSNALKKEIAIKRLSRDEKTTLITVGKGTKAGV